MKFLLELEIDFTLKIGNKILDDLDHIEYDFFFERDGEALNTILDNIDHIVKESACSRENPIIEWIAEEDLWEAYEEFGYVIELKDPYKVFKEIKNADIADISIYELCHWIEKGTVLFQDNYYKFDSCFRKANEFVLINQGENDEVIEVLRIKGYTFNIYDRNDYWEIVVIE